MPEILDKIRAWISGSAPDGRDALASLVLAAREDAEFREQLLFVLRLPPTQRGPLIATALEQMTLRGEPAVARAAFRVLSTEEGARQAIQAIEAGR
jgi:hypothetical protein